MAMLFAATYPERVFALVLFQGKPRFVRAPDFPWAPTREQYEIETRSRSPSCRDSAELERAYASGSAGRPRTRCVERARATRLTVSPGALLALGG